MDNKTTRDRRVPEGHSAVLLLFASWARGLECLNYVWKIVGMPLHLWLLMLHGGHALHAEIRRLRSSRELAESLEVGVDSERVVLVIPTEMRR